MTENNIFRKHSNLFRRYVVDIMNRSAEYGNFVTQFDTILLLADRVYVAFAEHMEFNRVSKVGELLTAVQDVSGGGRRDIDIETLLQSTEQWLKAVLWVADRPSWHVLNQNKKTFTLFPCIRDLGLLTQMELDDYQKISDEVRQLIYWSSKDRNYVTHETSHAPEYVRIRYLPSALLTLIAPICKHYESIRKNLRGLVASPTLENPEVASLIRLIEGERRNHLSRFRARQTWIAQLKERLLDDTPKSKTYLLLTGHEGMGKSALAAKLSDELTHHHLDLLGASVSETKKVAPWLPGVILHFGKQSNAPAEIVRLLLAQINALLLNPIELSDLPTHPTEDVNTASSLAYGDFPPSNRVSGMFTSSESMDPEIRLPSSYLVVQRSTYYQSSADLPFHTQSKTQDSTQYRRALYLALDQLSREYGPSIVIIDAVDEISPDGSRLDFLPDHLPPQISVLLTARHGSQAVSWLASNRDCEKIRLRYFDRSEIPELTGLDDSKEDEAEFNERLWKESRGWPVLVQAAVNSLAYHRDDLTKIQIATSADDVFARQAREWERSALDANDPTLTYLLNLLSIFEPTDPLDLEHIQSFLTYYNIDVSFAYLRRTLQPVRTQLEGLETGRIKLSLKAFAEYIRERYFSKRDLRNNLENIVRWLSTDEELPPKLLSSFLQYWTNPAYVSDDRCRTTSSKLIDMLIERNDPEVLYEIFQRSFVAGIRSQPKRIKDFLLPFSTKCLHTAAEFGHLESMRVLGHSMIGGLGFKENPAKGEEWLRKAAELGDVHAQRDLGNLLIEGQRLTGNPDEGEEWLQRAADNGDEDAKGLLAVRLIDGDGLKPDVETGELILRELVSIGNEKACLALAERLLEGLGVKQNIEEGEKVLHDLIESGNKKAVKVLAEHLLRADSTQADKDRGIDLLRSLIDSGDVSAIVRLSNFFLDNENATEDQKIEGEVLLRKAVDAENLQAQKVYAIRLLNGDGITQNISMAEKLLTELAFKDDSAMAMTVLGEHYINLGKTKDGQEWLTKACNAGHTPAMTFLGDCLINGNGIGRNVYQGQSWLQKAARAGDPNAMGLLGSLLLQGDILKQNQTEGSSWLRKAAQTGETQAMRVLGIRLIDGDGISKDTSEGEKWLRKAAAKGDLDASVILGIRLIDGNGIPKDTGEGEKYLRKAADSRDLVSMAILGSRLIEGDGIPKNESEGERWLRKAADGGEIQAMRALGIRLLDGDGVLKDDHEGEKWLRKAANENDLDAIEVLGNRLLDGDGIPKDEREGEMWLRQAANAGEPDAILSLSNRLLDGDGIPKNEVEGEEWLRKAANAGELQAMLHLGVRLIEGDCIAKNTAEGQQWIRSVIEKRSKEIFNNLLYALRRGSLLPSSEGLSLDSLIPDRKQQELGMLGINYALCLASGFDCEKNWQGADDVVRTSGLQEEEKRAVMDWWYNNLTLRRDDAEGHLVVGWLVRHGFTSDPDGESIFYRMQMARNGGWDVPDWMDSKA